jgi:FtsP/CotA-like multicopper oxidase with cupredoxin domain
MKQNVILWVFSLLLASTCLFSQSEKLIIGRTTGKLAVKKNLEIRTFGFTGSLSGQVTLPGSCIEAAEGDSLSIDFWNISQGNPVSLHCKEVEFLQRDKEKKIMGKKEPVHHMEHGSYSFLARKAGTYLYYSPENYPFNLQAGMFGILIIRPKNNDSLSVWPFSETLWCSYEIDTAWHTDAIMGTEYDPESKPVILPEYKPDYFLINSDIAQKAKGLQSLGKKKEKVLLRLANSGLYVHEIQFPSGIRLQLISGNDKNITASATGHMVQLHPGECFELLVFLGDATEKEQIVYHYIDSISKKERYKAAVPVFY